MPERRRFWAPGRVNLIGEHTDHTGGLVLPVAIDRGITLEAELGGDVISLSSDEMPGMVTVRADGVNPPATGWARYVSAVAIELEDVVGRPSGVRGHLSSTLPMGAGLSSSAALEVVVALALCAASDVIADPMWLAALCQRAEHRAVGVPSGVMDQAASLLGTPDHAILLDCTTLVHELVPMPADHVLVVLDSGVRRRLSDSGYEARTRELARALPVLGGRRPADVSPDELPLLLADLDPLASRRLRHVVTENDRVRTAARSLRDGDLAALGTVMAEGHASLRDDFEVSTPELDTLVRLAIAHGATAARMTGGGFGGSVVALIPADDAPVAAERVLSDYRKHNPLRLGYAFATRASPGAGEIR